jgi:hypothetical protein
MPGLPPRSTWRSLIPRPVREPDDAVAFVEKVGFCTWLPVPGLDLPNLGEALTPEAGGPAQHGIDESNASLAQVEANAVFERTWFWKDDLHLERRLYYALVIRGQPSFIATDVLPDFIAALGSAEASIERDPYQLLQAGRLSLPAAVIHEFLLEHGAQPSRELHRGTGIRARTTHAQVARAVIELQRRFVICKVGLTGRTRGLYSYLYDLAERFCPEAFAVASKTDREEARRRIRERLRSFGIEPDRAMEERLFLWSYNR